MRWWRCMRWMACLVPIGRHHLRDCLDLKSSYGALNGAVVQLPMLPDLVFSLELLAFPAASTPALNYLGKRLSLYIAVLWWWTVLTQANKRAWPVQEDKDWQP
ncbi:hypothetical protein PMIN03_010649 [Paraphaeosphaeria minitans]